MHHSRSQPSSMNGLFQDIQYETLMSRAAHASPYNVAREGVDDEGNVEESPLVATYDAFFFVLLMMLHPTQVLEHPTIPGRSENSALRKAGPDWKEATA